MYTIIYFSPTGNVQHLANKLGDLLKTSEAEILPLEFTEPEHLKKNRHLVLIHAIHGFNAPRTVKRFVKNLPSGLYDLVSIVAVGCNTGWVNGAVSSDLRKQFHKKGYTIARDEIFAMPLTFIMNFPDELNVKLIAESEFRIAELGKALSEETVEKRDVPAKSYILNFLGKGESPAARMFGLELHANKDCISCGLCWENCPEKNIKEKKNGKPGFGFSCSMCMRCIYNCPEKSISPYVSKFIPIKNGYSLSKYLKEN